MADSNSAAVAGSEIASESTPANSGPNSDALVQLGIPPAHEAGLTGPFIGLNGDTFFSGSLARLLEEHVRRDDVATDALVSLSGSQKPCLVPG